MNLDLLIVGALLADGTGSPLRPADVGVRHGRILLLPPSDPVRPAPRGPSTTTPRHSPGGPFTGTGPHSPGGPMGGAAQSSNGPSAGGAAHSSNGPSAGGAAHSSSGTGPPFPGDPESSGYGGQGSAAAASHLPGGIQAREVVDGRGLVLAPGFIDVHTHSDAVTLLGPDAWELAAAPVRMGVTVEICGNCGSGLFPALPERIPEMRGSSRAGFGGNVPIFQDFDGFAGAHGSAPRSNHLASLVGHGTLRAGVVGYEDRAASPYELEVMCDLLDTALAQGAAGLSTGLIYTPGTYGGTDEVVALAKVAARHGRPYVTHLRDEMSRVEEALEEAVEIARRSGAALHVSHHKTAGKHAWGRTEKTLATIAALRADLDVTCDVYPYTEASTSLSAMLPPWANDGGTAGLLARLKDAGQRERMRQAIADGVPGWENTVGNGGWDRISVACATRHPEVEGRTIASLGGDPVDAAAELLLAENGEVTIISHSMREDDVRRVLGSEFSMIGSDGVPKPGHPHPRLAGTFPRVLGRYVRDQGLLPLESAVHKMTGMAAERFGLRDRGVVRDGAHADLVLFDPATVADGATYQDPLLPPAGLRLVVTAGEVVVRDGALTSARPGGVVRPRG